MKKDIRPIPDTINNFDLITIEDMMEYWCLSRVGIKAILSEMNIEPVGTRRILVEGRMSNKNMYSLSIVHDVDVYLAQKYGIKEIKSQVKAMLLDLQNE